MSAIGVNKMNNFLHFILRKVIFLSIAKAMAYHHDAVVHIIAEGVYHHTKCVFCRLDDI